MSNTYRVVFANVYIHKHELLCNENNVTINCTSLYFTLELSGKLFVKQYFDDTYVKTLYKLLLSRIISILL